MLVVAGEALVDMVGDASFHYVARAGGSCFNVAMALGRLGHEVGFGCPMSSDALGRMLAKTLETSRVRLLIGEPVSEATSLAVVSISADGQPTYAFYRDNTADRTITADGLKAALPSTPEIFHTGSLALIGDDGAYWMEGAAEARRRGAVISLDPNVRPGMIGDAATYRRRMADYLLQADMIKMSDEDLTFLAPGTDPMTAFLNIVQVSEPAVAVLTLGEEGAVGVTANGLRVQQPAITPGTVADTIGAGDCLQAGLLSSLHGQGLTTATALAAISDAGLREALRRGTLAAGLNCTRQGCDPSWQDELDREMSRLA
ncbi:MAG: carbohydrate kinase family protein [Alphaproteobacteria bacterium]